MLWRSPACGRGWCATPTGKRGRSCHPLSRQSIWPCGTSRENLWRACSQPTRRIGARPRLALCKYRVCDDPYELRDRTRAAMSMGYNAVKFYPLPAVNSLEGPSAYRAVAACCEAVRDESGKTAYSALISMDGAHHLVAVQMEAAVRHTAPLWIETNRAGRCRRVAKGTGKFQIAVATGERYNSRWQFREILSGDLLMSSNPMLPIAMVFRRCIASQQWPME